MIDAALLKAMAKAGVTADQIAQIAAEYDALTAEKRAEKREQNRIRQQNHRSRNAVSRVTKRDECDAPLDKDAPHTPQEINPPRSEPKGSSLTPRAALETVLDPERAAAVVDHRKRIGKPLTPHAAQLLAAKMAKCPDPNFAADEMISNGWQGFKPEWLEPRSPPPRQATSPPQNDIAAAFDAIAAGKSPFPESHHEPDFPTIETSYERRN